VKNISDRVDELTLRKVFETCGAVSSCCVIRDVSTNKSRGFGFVKFAEVEVAELAIEKFNGVEYAGKILEVKFANTDGDSDGQGSGGGAQPNDNIYVKGLPPSWSQDDLKSYFSQFGHIVECRLLHANKSTSSGALIRFLREHEATAAVKKANGLTLVGSATSLVVRYAETQNKPKKTQGNGSTSGEDSVHNGAAIREAMQNIGRIPSNDGLSELLSNEEDFAAINVLGSSPTHRFGNLTASAPAGLISSNQLSAGGNVCVQNLPLHADELFLYKTFAPYGAILSAKVIRNDWNGLSSGVAVLVFRRHTDALTAQQALMQARSSLNVTVQAQHLPH
jgi:ELAV like protein 2/3/4